MKTLSQNRRAIAQNPASSTRTLEIVRPSVVPTIFKGGAVAAGATTGGVAGCAAGGGTGAFVGFCLGGPLGAAVGYLFGLGVGALGGALGGGMATQKVLSLLGI
jgi:hypothetical protein